MENIKQFSIQIFNELGPGYKEHIYVNAMCVHLRNEQFLSEIRESRNIRIKNYEEFKKKFEEAKQNQFKNYSDPYSSKNMTYILI